MATTPASSFEALMKGVTSWNVPKDAIPCELLLTGEAAFPVMVNDKGQVLIAASSYGQGRLVVVSHEGYLLDAGFAPFLRNAVGWLCPSPAAPTGVHPSLASLVSILQASGVPAQVQPEVGAPVGVYCISAYIDTMTAELIQFVKSGGGLLIGGQAWYWASQHGPDRVLSGFPGNEVTSVAGVYFTDIYGDIDQFKVSKKIPKIPLYTRCGEDLRQDQQQLLEGISELDFNTDAVPSQLLVHGALAFPLGLDASLGCFLAAARYGRGRVVLAAHEAILCYPKLGPFLLNAVRWLARGQTGKLGVATDLETLCTLLSEHGLECSLQPHLTQDLRVYCCTAYSDKEAKQLQEFVAEGGGLLIGGQAWWWSYQNPGRSALAHFPGNIVLNCFGLSILAQTLHAGCFPVPTPEMQSYHFRKALSEFQAALSHGARNLEKQWLAKLGADGAAFLQIPAKGVPAYKSVHRHMRKLLRLFGLPAVSREHPVAGDSFEAAVLCLATELARSGTDCSQLALELGICTCSSGHPFTVEIDGNNPDHCDAWVSTGLYLQRGESAEVSLPEAAASAGLKVQIGCHTDDLTKASKLSRAPVVTHQCYLDRTKQSICCLWGGLLYVIVPKGSKLGSVSVTIKRVVPAPYYKLGKTSLKAWKKCIQRSQVPWGELATDNIILTVPTANLRDLEDPEPVLRLWDEMMHAIAQLAARPFPFCCPERIVADVQISAAPGGLWMGAIHPALC
ncbi:TRPM8 channel-associated factor 2-like isoform X2 [Meles meles]|uniref:TRPM8 channel-associated factor 2-like isoform X2 n=1 Tax=Meles meles TaxID=9662 RepID=UPI001E69CF8C|nr:TRPM8 channel-associated factor 2-like isoform X2 [Meles meles]